MSTLVAVVVGAVVMPAAGHARDAQSAEDAWRACEASLKRSNWQAALEALERYVVSAPPGQPGRHRVAPALDAAGTLALDAGAGHRAEALFVRFSELTELSAVEHDAARSWLAGLQERHRFDSAPAPPTDLPLDEADAALDSLRVASALDPRRRKHVAAAEAVLIPFVVHHTRHPRHGEALLMLAELRWRHPSYDSYEAALFYLRQVIHRYPHTDVAQRAFERFVTQVRLGYTGSGGDFTPPSYREELARLRSRARRDRRKG